jgi:HSP20 family protein
MLSRLTDFDGGFAVLDELRRQMDRVWEDVDGSWNIARTGTPALSGRSWPRFNVHDAGTNLIVTADVPGLSEKDIAITLEDGVLSIADERSYSSASGTRGEPRSGERKTRAPEGYVVHRRERAAHRFARAIALPLKVDPERTSATVKDGVLTITLAKTPEARPRQITVSGQS